MSKPIHPDALVYVEWYHCRYIPRTHHALIVPYWQAVEWHAHGAQMQCFTIDDDLLEEAAHERGSQTY